MTEREILEAVLKEYVKGVLNNYSPNTYDAKSAQNIVDEWMASIESRIDLTKVNRELIDLEKKKASLDEKIADLQSKASDIQAEIDSL
jgi:peptidoglycan hydrolase CwlO-like protein